jgi:hypothetical protein
MNNTTSSRRRYSVRAAAVAATAAVIFGAAACGTETASDSDPAAPGGVPAGGAPGATIKPAPYFPGSADAQERRARAEQLEQFRRHLEGSAPASHAPVVAVRRQPHGHVLS